MYLLKRAYDRARNGSWGWWRRVRPRCCDHAKSISRPIHSLSSCLSRLITYSLSFVFSLSICLTTGSNACFHLTGLRFLIRACVRVSPLYHVNYPHSPSDPLKRHYCGQTRFYYAQLPRKTSFSSEKHTSSLSKRIKSRNRSEEKVVQKKFSTSHENSNYDIKKLFLHIWQRFVVQFLSS